MVDDNEPSQNSDEEVMDTDDKNKSGKFICKICKLVKYKKQVGNSHDQP